MNQANKINILIKQLAVFDEILLVLSSNLQQLKVSLGFTERTATCKRIFKKYIIHTKKKMHRNDTLVKINRDVETLLWKGRSLKMRNELKNYNTWTLKRILIMLLNKLMSRVTLSYI